MSHGLTSTARGKIVLTGRSPGSTALGIALAVAVAGFFVTIAIPALGLAGEDLMPLRPAAPPPALPELAPVRPPAKRTSVRPGPLVNIVRLRIPSPGRYENDSPLVRDATATAIRPPETAALRPTPTPAPATQAAPAARTNRAAPSALAASMNPTVLTTSLPSTIATSPTAGTT